MTKWEYIRMISGRGDQFGRAHGVLDLLDWCKKSSTSDVTQEEAKLFWDDPFAPLPRSNGQPAACMPRASQSS